VQCKQSNRHAEAAFPMKLGYPADGQEAMEHKLLLDNLDEHYD
jgi:hypothetical protein